MVGSWGKDWCHVGMWGSLIAFVRPSVPHEEVKFISVGGGATQELLAGIRASQNYTKDTAFALVCVMPYRRDMYWFPRAQGSNSCAGSDLPRHQCEGDRRFGNLGLAKTLTFARSFFCGCPAKKKIFLPEPGGGPPQTYCFFCIDSILLVFRTHTIIFFIVQQIERFDGILDVSINRAHFFGNSIIPANDEFFACWVMNRCLVNGKGTPICCHNLHGRAYLYKSYEQLVYVHSAVRSNSFACSAFPVNIYWRPL